MTPKEKAVDLVNKFYHTSSHNNSVEVRWMIAKEHAIICCDELVLESYHNKEFWKEVRLEIATL